MKRSITLPIKAFSINSVYCKNRSFKTQSYKEWSMQVFHRLSTEENLQALQDLREFFDPKIHSYSINLKFYYPSDILYTKKGSLSARAHDISNIEKPLIDLLFLPVYHNKPAPYGCPNLNIDDKFISEMSSKKLSADAHKIEIELQIIPI